LAARLRVLLDTSAWIEFFCGNAPWSAGFAADFFNSNTALLADLVYVENLRGARTDTEAKLLVNRLGEFERISVLDFDLAVSAIDHHRLLRSKGVTIRSTIDLIVATWCISNAVPLLHADRGFTGFEQHLGLERWVASD
jgi:predicted nucleic acid-binding protein